MNRTYTMVLRAETKTAATSLILDAAERLFSRELYEKVSFNSIAHESGMGIQTVVRHFPTKELLFLASMTRSLEKADQSRNYLPGQTLVQSVQQLLDYYESHGRIIIHYLDQVATNPAFAPVTQAGWEAHIRWTDILFFPHLNYGKDSDPIRKAQIEAILDIRVWEMLRIRKGLSIADMSKVILGLLQPFCNSQKVAENISVSSV